MKPSLWIADDDWAEPLPPLAGTEVICDDRDAAEFSGLYDADGNPLFREKNPVGFRIR